MKSRTTSAVAFGAVLQAARKRSGMTQGDVARLMRPTTSMTSVSMAEAGSRPPKTQEIVHGYGEALGLNGHVLVELWWAMQGMVGDRDDETGIPVTWWKKLRLTGPAARAYRRDFVEAKRDETNSHEMPPSPQQVALCEAVCAILRRLLGRSWDVGYAIEIGSRGPVADRRPVLTIELCAGDADEGSVTATFVCPEPADRPVPPNMTAMVNTELPRDLAWILASVEAMTARERAAVAGFIRGLQEGASPFSDGFPPLR